MIETITITGDGGSAYEIPAKAIKGSVKSKNDTYTIEEIDGSLDIKTGRILVLITPELPEGFKLELEYKVPDKEALSKTERTLYGETVKSSSLKDILVVLSNIIARQDQLEKQLYDKVTYAELDGAIYPIKEILGLIVEDIKLKQKERESTKTAKVKQALAAFDLSPEVLSKIEQLLNSKP